MGSIVEYKNKYQAAIARLKTMREQGAEIGERAVGGALCVGAGYGVGVAVKKGWDKTIPGTEIPAIPAIGAAIALAGIVGLAGKGSEAAVYLGAGTLGGYGAILASRP